jgi:hypothetical protein
LSAACPRAHFLQPINQRFKGLPETALGDHNVTDNLGLDIKVVRRAAVENGEFENPCAVCTVVRPEWIEGIVGEPGVVECSVPAALALYLD